MSSSVFYPTVNSDNGFWSQTGEIFPGGWASASMGVGKNSTNSNNTWVKFDNVVIPPGATVSGAVLKLTVSYRREGAGCSLRVSAVKSSSPTPPTSAAEADGFTLSDNYSAWSPFPVLDADEYALSPDISSVIQEIMGLPGWASGNSILLLVKDSDSLPGSLRDIAALGYNSGAGKPELSVTWSEEPAGTSITPEPGAISVTGNSVTLVSGDLPNVVYEWEGDKTISRGNFTWKSKLVLLPAMTNFTAARVEADYSADQSAYFEALAERDATIARNAAIISAGTVGGEIADAAIGVYPVGGDSLETVPVVGAYSGPASLQLKIYADGVLKQTIDLFSSRPFRLKGGYRSKQYAFQIEGNIAVKKIEIATSIGDIVEA